jgi:hypothetical protein
MTACIIVCPALVLPGCHAGTACSKPRAQMPSATGVAMLVPLMVARAVSLV